IAPEVVFLEESPVRPTWDVLDVLCMVGLFFAAFLPGVGVLALLRKILSPGDQGNGAALAFGLGVLAVQGVASAASVHGVGRWRGGYGWADIGFRPMSLAWWAISAGAGLACLPLLGIVALLVSKLIGQKDIENPQLDFLAPGGQFSWGAGLGMFILAGVLVPM